MIRFFFTSNDVSGILKNLAKNFVKMEDDLGQILAYCEGTIRPNIRYRPIPIFPVSVVH